LSVPTAESTPPAVISVRGVGKCYRIYARPQDRLKQMVFSRLGHQYGRDFWALRRVDFELAPGERFGVIGRNGSGKSTLLEMIAGTLAPTEGEIQVNGRVSALLELGSGFNPEFTGRENVFINAAIQGLTRAQVEERFDEIAAFADIGSFIDQPVKLYSSGMFVRLAFAVSTSIDADVLLIDEALAVGDVFFRQKCYRRLEKLRERNVAVILVSHGMGEVEEFCDRALLLDRGRAVFAGPAVEAVKRYYLIENQERFGAVMPTPLVQPVVASGGAATFPWPEDTVMGAVAPVAQVSDGWARCTMVGLSDMDGRAGRVFEQGQRAVFWFEFELLRDVGVLIAGLVIHSDKGTIVHGKSTIESGAGVPQGARGGDRVRVRHEIALSIGIGEYTFEVGLAMANPEVYEQRGRLSHHELEAQLLRLCAVPFAGQFAVIFRRPGHGVQLLHHGIADLPGDLRMAVVTPSEP
jgi:lipopolysaccharide transport system ATP-binding protein